MQNHDWSKFIKRIPVKADMKDIYEAWATQEGLEKWFLRKAEFTKLGGKLRDRNALIKKDDTYEWMWHGWSDEVVERGSILDANDKDFLKFTFGKAGIVSVSIKKEGGENIIELVQEKIPVDEDSKFNYYIGYSEGWTFYLANLKSVLEGGLDLRNKKEKLKQVVNS